MPARKAISISDGTSAIRSWCEKGEATPRSSLALAVRFTLQVLAEEYPGGAVELRVPPFGAVQILEGTSHTRGTPPAVVEMNAATWMRLATGELTWAEGRARGGGVSASGERSDLSEILPVPIARRMATDMDSATTSTEEN
ncbi:sterol carrier family protein [Dermabacter vaginalis]|uniref:sterol carrier family protein n=1 Tax=Dermabacter vaginalis TaxID=1630135 RepID=UPI001EF4B27F|nr:sterol carrier family protein [Dermabacter vaginalis]MCG7444258.1 sterol carrier family protein [Dermabacter vaginalis]